MDATEVARRLAVAFKSTGLVENIVGRELDDR